MFQNNVSARFKTLKNQYSPRKVTKLKVTGLTFDMDMHKTKFNGWCHGKVFKNLVPSADKLKLF